jgi:hypothetical protein
MSISFVTILAFGKQAREIASLFVCLQLGYFLELYTFDLNIDLICLFASLFVPCVSN